MHYWKFKVHLEHSAGNLLPVDSMNEHIKQYHAKHLALHRYDRSIEWTPTCLRPFKRLGKAWKPLARLRDVPNNLKWNGFDKKAFQLNQLLLCFSNHTYGHVTSHIQTRKLRIAINFSIANYSTMPIYKFKILYRLGIPYKNGHPLSMSLRYTPLDGNSVFNTTFTKDITLRLTWILFLLHFTCHPLADKPTICFRTLPLPFHHHHFNCM